MNSGFVAPTGWHRIREQQWPAISETGAALVDRICFLAFKFKTFLELFRPRMGATGETEGIPAVA
jgi:hypothetical protein